MPHDHHDHDHDAHEHASLEAAVRAHLIEKGVVTQAELDAQAEWLEGRSPALGAQVVAKAWADPGFKARLLSDARAALGELGIDWGPAPELQVVENTPAEHNLVVCTLCSCYPRMLLGAPPAWYKSLEYRSRAVSEPRAVLAEFGVTLPAGTAVRVVDSTADLRYLVLPLRPAGTEGWDEARLAGLVVRDAMIGTALPVA